MNKRRSVTLSVRMVAALALIVTAMITTAGDWPTYLHDPQRTSANLSETILSPLNAAHLSKLWSFTTGGTVAASATVVSGTVYVGSWDGYEYALDATTGAQKWKTFLGQTYNAGCSGLLVGVNSSATVQNGLVYVGGGHGYGYVLNAATGAIVGQVPEGNPATYYTWSSPLIYNGYAYVNLASHGDCPLAQGVMLQIRLSTGRLTHVFDVVPTGQLGGGLWSSPAVDPATNTIYATSGNEGQEPPSSQPYSLSMLALNAATLTLKSSWQIPPAQNYGDSDFGATPTLFTDAVGHPLVGAVNKNGIFYAFDRADIAAGPLWEQPVADPPTTQPGYGGGSISPAAFGRGALYVAGGTVTISGTVHPGSVQAFDPTTGRILWQHIAPGPVLGAVVYASGLVIDGAGNTLEVLNAATGTLLFSYTTARHIFASPSIANGQIFEGSNDHNLYAFGLKQ